MFTGLYSELPWPARLQGPLFRKIAVLRRALYLASKESREAEDGLWALVEVSVRTALLVVCTKSVAAVVTSLCFSPRLVEQSARESPAVTARTLSRHMPGAPKLEEVVPSGVVKCAGGVCDRQALPFSRFCLLREPTHFTVSSYPLVSLCSTLILCACRHLQR